MPRSNNTWPAAAALLIILGSTSSSIRSASAFVPLASTTGSCPSRHAGTSLLPVSATPVSPTTQPSSTSGGGDSSSSNDNESQFKDLHEANMALDAIAMKCSNPSKEPIISRADQCQSQWEAMRGSSLEPDTVSFNTVLKAWSRCCQALADYKKQGNNNPPMVTSGMEGMQLASQDHPQVYTAKDAAERATLLLLSQEQEYENGNLAESARPDTTSYNEAIGAWARSGVAEAPHNAERILKRMMDHETVEPDGISYNGVVEAWAYSGKPESLEKVKQIWQKMEKLYAESNGKEAEGKNPIKPTIRTVNCILQAHAKRAQELVEARDVDSARKVARDAEEFLDLMKDRYKKTNDPDHMPDVMTYTTVMDTFGRCGRYHATLRAQALLDELKGLYEKSGRQNPKLKPNVRTYTSLITAWSKTRSPDSPSEAERLLVEMEKSGDPDVLPNARSFTAVIHTWGRSADHTKAQRALKVLQTMKAVAKETGRKDAAPTIIAYNACLDSCARCQGNVDQQTAALKIAFAVLKAINLDPTMEATAMTYATILRAISFLLEPGDQRNQVGKTVFEKAVKAGMVDFRVLLQLKKSVHSTILSEVLQGVQQDRSGNFDFNAIPPGWNRNVR